MATAEITEEWKSLCFIVLWSVFKTNGDLCKTSHLRKTRFYNVTYWNKRSNADLEEIANSIANVAVSCRENGFEVVVSATTPGRDKLNEKGTVANEKTKGLCLEKNIYFLDHRNFNTKYHLNGRKLCPNKMGSGVLAFNFLQYFNNTWLVNNVIVIRILKKTRKMISKIKICVIARLWAIISIKWI